MSRQFVHTLHLFFQNNNFLRNFEFCAVRFWRTLSLSSNIVIAESFIISSFIQIYRPPVALKCPGDFSISFQLWPLLLSVGWPLIRSSLRKEKFRLRGPQILCLRSSGIPTGEVND